MSKIKKAGPDGWIARRRGDLLGALSSSILTLPVAIGCGVIAFSPLGPGYAPVAALAGLTAAAVSAITAAILGGSRYQITGPVSSLAVVLASTLAAFLVDPSLGANFEARAPVAVVLVFMCVGLAGILQITLGLLRLGDLVKFIPHTVVAGLMGGIAARILWSQVPLFAEFHPGGVAQILSGGIALNAIGIAVALAVAAIMAGAGLILKRRGDALVALVLGSVGVHLLASLAGIAAPGGSIGSIAMHVPLPGQIENTWIVLNEVGSAVLLMKLAAPAAIIAVLGALQSLLAAAAMDARTDTRHDSNRELIGQGAANLVAGAFGGVAAAGSAPRSLASYLAGANSRLAGVGQGVIFLVVLAFGGDVVGEIPLIVITGILIVYAGRIAEAWIGRFVAEFRHAVPGRERRVAAFDLVVIAAVGALTAGGELLAAVAFGIALASFLFVVQAGRHPVHRIGDGGQARSRTHRPLSEMSLLAQHGHAIAIVEAEGSIFFGSAERLADRIAGLGTEAKAVILDFRRVGEIDSTGAAILRRLRGQFDREHRILLFSYLTPNDRRWHFLLEMGVAEHGVDDRFFTDTDTALAWAENQLLQSLGAGTAIMEELPLDRLEALAGFDAAAISALAQVLIRRDFAAGEVLFEDGASGSALYLVAKGRIVALATTAGNGNDTVRLAGMGPGVVFGEIALLTGAPRTARCVAETDAVCWMLDQEGLDRLRTEVPAAALQFMFNLARQSAFRLDAASRHIRALES